MMANIIGFAIYVLGAVFFFTAGFGYFRSMRDVRKKGRRYDSLVAVDIAASQRQEIIRQAVNHKLLQYWSATQPSLDQHIQMLQAGRDISKIYPKELRDIVRDAVYQDNPIEFWEYCKATKPELMKEWIVVHRTRKRIT